jgi:hypothetical protein
VTHSEPKDLKPILPRVAAGESRAMNLCIDQYGNLVWGIVRRYVRDVVEAEDLVQEIFTEVWKKAAAYDPQVGAESTYVGMISRRRSIDFLRRKGRQPGFEPLTAAEFIPIPDAGTPSVSFDPETIKTSSRASPQTLVNFSTSFLTTDSPIPRSPKKPDCLSGRSRHASGAASSRCEINCAAAETPTPNPCHESL